MKPTPKRPGAIVNPRWPTMKELMDEHDRRIKMKGRRISFKGFDARRTTACARCTRRASTADGAKILASRLRREVRNIGARSEYGELADGTIKFVLVRAMISGGHVGT